MHSESIIYTRNYICNTITKRKTVKNSSYDIGPKCVCNDLIKKVFIFTLAQFKVQLFWEGHKNLPNIPHDLDIYEVKLKFTGGWPLVNCQNLSLLPNPCPRYFSDTVPGTY